MMERGEGDVDLFSLESSYKTQRNALKLYSWKFRLYIRKKFFAEVARYWYKLSKEMAMASIQLVF